MSVYNAEQTLAQTIESILSQRLKDFEFIIINDGSTDQSKSILEKFSHQDSRIRLHHQQNSGLTRSLNLGIRLAKGKYLARQDADDISYPDRLNIQFDYMESHPKVALLGSNSDDLYPGGLIKKWGHESQEEIAQSVFLKTPFPHSSVMMRTAIAKTLGGYDESFKTAQDMEFWMRFAKSYTVAMLPDVLIKRTISDSSISSTKKWRQFYDALRARLKHNRFPRKLKALFYSLRGLLISFLPYKIASICRRKKHNI